MCRAKRGSIFASFSWLKINLQVNHKSEILECQLILSAILDICLKCQIPFIMGVSTLDVAEFVQNVKKYCDIKGIKPTTACKESGAGKDLINQIERRRSIPSVEKVQLLAQYLEVTTSELLGEDPSKSTNGPPRPYLVFRFNQLSPKSQEDVMAFVEYRWVQDQKERADEEPKTP